MAILNIGIIDEKNDTYRRIPLQHFSEMGKLAAAGVVTGDDARIASEIRKADPEHAKGKTLKECIALFRAWQQSNREGKKKSCPFPKYFESLPVVPKHHGN